MWFQSWAEAESVWEWSEEQLVSWLCWNAPVLQAGRVHLRGFSLTGRHGLWCELHTAMDIHSWRQGVFRGIFLALVQSPGFAVWITQ